MNYLNFVGGIGFGVFVYWLLSPNSLKDSWETGYASGYEDAYKMPASETLELTCAGMWFGKGGEQYWKAWKEKINE